MLDTLSPILQTNGNFSYPLSPEILNLTWQNKTPAPHWYNEHWNHVMPKGSPLDRTHHTKAQQHITQDCVIQRACIRNRSRRTPYKALHGSPERRRVLLPHQACRVPTAGMWQKQLAFHLQTPEHKIRSDLDTHFYTVWFALFKLKHFLLSHQGPRAVWKRHIINRQILLLITIAASSWNWQQLAAIRQHSRTPELLVIAFLWFISMVQNICSKSPRRTLLERTKDKGHSVNSFKGSVFWSCSSNPFRRKLSTADFARFETKILPLIVPMLLHR